MKYLSNWILILGEHANRKLFVHFLFDLSFQTYSGTLGFHVLPCVTDRPAPFACFTCSHVSMSCDVEVEVSSDLLEE